MRDLCSALIKSEHLLQYREGNTIFINPSRMFLGWLSTVREFSFWLWCKTVNVFHKMSIMPLSIFPKSSVGQFLISSQFPKYSLKTLCYLCLKTPPQQMRLCEIVSIVIFFIMSTYLCRSFSVSLILLFDNYQSLHRGRSFYFKVYLCFSIFNIRMILALAQQRLDDWVGQIIVGECTDNGNILFKHEPLF